MFKLMDKEIIAILRKLCFLNWPYGSRGIGIMSPSASSSLIVSLTFLGFGSITLNGCINFDQSLQMGKLL